MWTLAEQGELYGNGAASEPYPSHQPPTPPVPPHRILPLGHRSSEIEALSEPCADPTDLRENLCGEVFLLGFSILKKEGAGAYKHSANLNFLLDHGYFRLFTLSFFYILYILFFWGHANLNDVVPFMLAKKNPAGKKKKL